MGVYSERVGTKRKFINVLKFKIMTKKDVALQQIKYFKDIEFIGYSIVTCGNCGTTLIRSLKATKVNCLCGMELDPCDCPDLWINGDEDNY